MADRLKDFQVLLWLLFWFGVRTYANLPTKCEITVEKTKYLITDWTWTVVGDKRRTYYINVCGNVDSKSCSKKSSVCSWSTADSKSENLGSFNSRVFNSTTGAVGFSIEYTGGQCTGQSSEAKAWKTTIFLRCGKFLGSPQFVDMSVSDKACVAVFEFVTNEACKKPPTVPEIPCSLYNDRDHKRRDLTPLIKLKGGYEVASSIPDFDFHINVCRGITAEINGHTQGCPANSSMCRVNTRLAKQEDVGNINFASKLTFSSSNDIILVYNTTEKASGCSLNNPVTTITFRCPKEMTDKGPVLTAAGDCRFEVLWETDFACPETTIMSTNSTSCVLDNRFVRFDLTKLTNDNNYKIGYDAMEHGGKKTHYIIFMNVCKPLGFACGSRGTNSTVCQERPDGAIRKSLGDISKQTLRYADRQLTLTYEHGEQCSSGLNRTTIIMFICDYHAHRGQPVFNSENYCFYYFGWKTKYACPPSRRTGTRCRVESPSGLRYDLSELVHMEGNSNWIALDGETSSSDKQMFINVCGQLVFNNETRKCDRAAAICMSEKSTGKVVSLGRYTDPPTLNQDNSIKLVYAEGSECKKDNTGKSIKIKSTITFVCQPGDLESPPVLVAHSQDNCHYQFMWKSAAACSLGLNRGQDCKVEDKDAGYVFDLSPLATHTWNKSDYYSVTVDRSLYRYQLKVCGGSNQTKCGSNIGACQTKNNNASFHKKLGQPNTMLYYYDGMLNLTYKNGEPCRNGVNRTTHITFLCNATAGDNGIGKPEYEKEDSCIYNFRWFTKYACLTKVTECIARSDSDQYDLTSLVKTKDNWSVPGGGGTFYINVCRMLNLYDDDDISGCSGTASVCLKKDDGTFVNLGSVSDPPHVEGKDITLTYINGDKCTQSAGKLYQSKITFVCKTGLMSTSLTFLETADSGCTYKFRWVTAAACKIVNVVGDNCAVKDPKSDTTFNLLPLMKRQNKGVYNGTLTDDEGKGTFELNICGDVPECRKEEDKKTDKVGACLKHSNGTTIVLGKSNKKLEYEGEILTLVYREGDNFAANGLQREVHIKFYCNSKVPFGKPAFASQLGNKYFFDFQTSLVCSASAVQCMVRGKGNKTYDLTPLGLIKGNWEAVDTRPQNKHLHYYINVCRAVNLNYPQEVTKCPGGPIGACQIDHKADKGFNLGYVQSDPQVADNGDLTLQYSGGTECHHQFNRSIRIVFSCSKQMGSPIFLAESPECEYLFTWQTPSACALTREQGDNCTVEDKQYGYMFNLSTLYNRTSDYDVSVSGASGTRIVLNVCNKLVSTPKECTKSKSGGACIIEDGKSSGTSIDPSNHLTYFNGQINMTYGKSPSPSVNFIFECDQETSGLQTGPTCEKKSEKLYECFWPTAFACRPMINVQCSIRNEDGSVDDQYDYSPLSESTRNWQAQITGQNLDGVSYFINVCRTVLLKGGAKHCPPTAGVCMVDKGGKTYNLGSIKRGPRKVGNNIYLMYDDGDDCGNDGKKYSSRIHMECGSTEEEPVFVRKSQQTCQYEFLWITSRACPVNTNNEVVFDNCTAINPQTNVLFDLSALRSGKDYVIYDKHNRSYHLNVCGPLVNSKSCSSKSGVCQVNQNTAFNAGMANSRLHFDDGVLYLNLSGGDDCHHVKKKRETIISFVCHSNYGKKDYGKPVFISENDCTYYIMWHTSLVCERQYECAAFTKVGASTVKYSLGRLMRSDTNWMVTNEEGVKNSYTYYVNLCRPLVPMPGTNCPAGAWACGVGSTNFLDLGYATEPPVASEGEVQLVYTGRTKCDPKDPSKVWKVHFTFICTYGTLGHPVLETNDKCFIRIRWLTSAACGDKQKAELDKCRVYDNSTGEYYDLNPLSRPDRDNSYFQVKQTATSRVFFISVCHGLDLNKASNCTKDGVAGVCLRTTKGNQKMYKALGLFKYKDMTYYKDEGMLILKYCSRECNSKESNLIMSRIIFVCDKNQSSVGKPELDTIGNYGADFTWRTHLVCPPAEEECSYSDGGKSYDLRLLTSRTRSWYYEHNKDRFWINICRGIRDGPKGCPSTASVCMIRKGSNKVNVVGVTSTQRMSVNDGKLQLTYSGLPPVEGCSPGKNSKVVFYFECGNNIGQPQFQSEAWLSCSFIIKWKSSVACQISRKKLDENHCVVKHPVTGAQIDFSQLVGSTGSTWTINGKDESNKQVQYAINICGELRKDLSSDCRGRDAICFNNAPYDMATKTFYYEGSIFSLEMKTTKKCDGTNYLLVVVINFQCSVGAGVGSPKFDYVSSSCHHVFLWPTSVVCSGDLSQNVTDIPAVHKAQKSPAKTNLGIAFGVTFAVILIVVLAVVLHKPSRRHSIISCLRWNFKRHVLRKEIRYPVYRYQKLDTVDDDDEADSLIKEAEDSDNNEENDDDDLLPF